VVLSRLTPPPQWVSENSQQEIADVDSTPRKLSHLQITCVLCGYAAYEIVNAKIIGKQLSNSELQRKEEKFEKRAKRLVRSEGLLNVRLYEAGLAALLSVLR
jgi:hypothetical protein